MAATPPLKRMLLTVVFGIGAGVVLAALVHYLSAGSAETDADSSDEVPELPCDVLVANDADDATPRCTCPEGTSVEPRENGDQACVDAAGAVRGPALLTADGARRYCVYRDGELQDGDSQCPAL